MTAPTARAFHGRVLVTFPESVLDDTLSRLAEDMNQSPAVQESLHELASALGWLACPAHSGEDGVLDPATYRVRRDSAIQTLRAVVGLVVLSLPPGTAGDLGRELEHAAAHILATSTQDVLRTLEGRDD